MTPALWIASDRTPDVQMMPGQMTTDRISAQNREVAFGFDNEETAEKIQGRDMDWWRKSCAIQSGFDIHRQHDFLVAIQDRCNSRRMLQG